MSKVAIIVLHITITSQLLTLVQYGIRARAKNR